ncbi:MAG: ABC transporter permease, partial [Pseudorhodoplanes sp.]
MWVFIARRLLSAIPVLCLTSVIVFLLMRLLPGDPVLTLIAQAQADVDEASVRSIIAQYNLDQPVYKQYLIWAGTLLTGDLGRSIVNN